MKINWSILKNAIPTHITFKKSEYEVVWVTDFKDGNTFGETRFNPNQIAIKTGENDKETVHTFFHELLHAASEEYDIGLTEKQVRRLEKSLTDWLKLDSITLRSHNAANKRKRRNSKRIR